MAASPARRTPPALPAHPGLVVIGASAGGVAALLKLSSALPAPFPAPILVVLHIGANTSVLPMLLSARGRNPAVHAEDGQALEKGTIYVAPPDRHMVVHDDRIRLNRGPKEHHSRPAIDPLFRSAALAHGARVVGVVLTGRLDDGTAGLQAIKQRGGVAVVQDPSEAEHPGMPSSALQTVEVDHCLPLGRIAAQLQRLVRTPAAPVEAAHAAAPALVHEIAVFDGEGDAMENLSAIGKPTTLACPDCAGVLWEIGDTEPARYRCQADEAGRHAELLHGLVVQA